MLEGVADEITAMIQAIGRDVTLRIYTTTGPDYDPVRTPNDVIGRATITDFRAKETDGTIIQSNDKRAHISSVSTLTKETKIIDGLIEYQIENLRTVAPGSETFLYIAQLRSGTGG